MRTITKQLIRLGDNVRAFFNTSAKWTLFEFPGYQGRLWVNVEEQWRYASEDKKEFYLNIIVRADHFGGEEQSFFVQFKATPEFNTKLEARQQIKNERFQNKVEAIKRQLGYQ